MTYDELERLWRTRLEEDEPKLNKKDKASIIRWLLGEDTEKWTEMSPEKFAVVEQGLDYRYRILCQRYLHTPPSQAYRKLINRLGSLIVLRSKIQTWVSLSRDRQRAVADVLQEVIQEMLNSDRNIQKQMTWISQCTQDERIRNILLFTALEEYCLRPIRNQPLLAFRFVNYLRRSQRGGMTQVPQQQMIRMISEEISGDEPDSSFSLLDDQAIESYQERQVWEEQQILRSKVQGEFNNYLGEKLGEEAQQWLDLYLQGKTQDEISQLMKIPIKQVYRLREKIGYHAIKVFAIKKEFELVANWLGISFERSFGLTSSQWQGFYNNLNDSQKKLIDLLTEKKKVEEIAKSFNWKKSQVYNEWTQLYLTAQNLRND
ncbi:MAG: HetZ-related protein 2 [Microcystaceae cyanobacterium]